MSLPFPYSSSSARQMMNPMEGMKGKLREQREWVKIRKTFSGLVKAAFPGILLTRGPCSDMKT
jgi:hypothetical protein